MLDSNIKIIGLENLARVDYQVSLRNEVKKIFGTNDSITIDELKSNTIFNNLIKNADEELKTKMYNKIEELAGNEIDIDEMQAVFCLLDSKSEKNEGADKDTRPEKYIFDTEFNITEKSGLFKIESDYNSNELKEVYRGMKSIANLYSVFNIE